MRKQVLLIIFLAAICHHAHSQELDTLLVPPTRLEVISAKTPFDSPALTAFLDTVKVSAKPAINDYSLLGVYAGSGVGMMYWNPTMKQGLQFVPYYAGICYTKMGKMFGFMPYFGFQAGAEFAQDGYRLEENTVYGYQSVRQSVAHAYYQAYGHFDFWKMRLQLHVGMYGGYRLDIQRFEQDPEAENYRPVQLTAPSNGYAESDIRWDFGVRGGVGFAFVFDPLEVHINATYKHSLSSIYEPDYLSKYYYRYANPMSLYVSVGVHYQLSQRIGRDRKALKAEAKRIVNERYGY